MKKFLKNAVLSMLIVCFLLNIVNLVSLMFEYLLLTPLVAESAREVAQEIQSSEEAYQALASFYASGRGAKVEIQASILGFSIILGIIIGIMIELERKAKLKLVLTYIVGFLTLTIAIMQYHLAQDISFFEDVLHNIRTIWIWYTVIFAIIFVIKLYISNKKTKKLNEILKSKGNR